MPICEGCGSSYDDTFKFCPYCGRRKPEPESVRIQVEVSDRDKWETCEIHRWTYHSKTRLDGNTRYEEDEGYLHAPAIGPKGKYNAGSSPLYSVHVKRSLDGRKEDRFSGIEVAHKILVDQLVRDGWESTGGGSSWWNQRFRRRLGEEYPAPPTTWEVEFRASWLQNAFYIHRHPVGTAKSPVAGPQSEAFSLGFLGVISRQEAKLLPTLNRFLDRLEKEGYEQVPASVSELGRRCRRRRPSWGYDDSRYHRVFWYYRILLKRD